MDPVTKLITVKRSDGHQKALPLDTSASLTDTRRTLAARDVMRDDDLFLTSDKIEIEKGDEAFVVLSEVLADRVLLLGLGAPVSPIDVSDGVARYNALSNDQRRAIFANIQVFRGLTIAQDGFKRTFRDIYSWKPGTMPRANNPSVNTQLTSSFAFTKVTRDLMVFGSHSASLSFSAPFASAEAEFKTEKKKTTTSSQISEFLTTRYIVRKVMLQSDAGNFAIAPDFVDAIRHALTGKDKVIQGYHDLLDVLNTWGYYVLMEFSLGGVIFATEETKITEFSEAEENRREFNGSFKASFKGIGGGAAYGHASGSTVTTTESSKFQHIELRSIGGQVGLEKDYERWAASLNPAVNWGLADAPKLYPSLMLLTGDAAGRDLLGKAVTLIERFAGHPAAAAAQPYLSMQAYNTVMQEMLNPF